MINRFQVERLENNETDKSANESDRLLIAGEDIRKTRSEQQPIINVPSPELEALRTKKPERDHAYHLLSGSESHTPLKRAA